MIPDEHRQFLESHNVCIVGFARKSGPPSLSPVYYYLDGDEIVFSTTKTRGKGRAVARNPELTLCIVDTNPPYPYLTIFGRAGGGEDVAVRSARAQRHEQRERVADGSDRAVRAAVAGDVLPLRGGERSQSGRQIAHDVDDVSHRDHSAARHFPARPDVVQRR